MLSPHYATDFPEPPKAYEDHLPLPCISSSAASTSFDFVLRW